LKINPYFELIELL